MREKTKLGEAQIKDRVFHELEQMGLKNDWKKFPAELTAGCASVQRWHAQIVLCDPHRCIVQGPARLAGEKMESPDIRAGMALLLAALTAHGTSVIRNVGQIDRGYERVDQKLRSLGAKIERVESE